MRPRLLGQSLLGQRLPELIVCAAMALAIPQAALAQAGSAGGSVGNDEKSLSGRREAPDPGRGESNAGANCVIADPTSTPLNLRTSPNGTIVGTVANGTRARILDQARDRGGEQWVYIADAGARPMGWVIRKFIVCR